MLITASNPRNTHKILLRELRIVVRQQSRALPLRQLLRQQRLTAVNPPVQAETHLGGTGVIGVLYQLLQHCRPLRIIQQHLSNPACEIHLLAEIFQKDRVWPRRRRRHGKFHFLRRRWLQGTINARLDSFRP